MCLLDGCAQIKPGKAGFVAPAKWSDDSIKVMPGVALIGMLMDMGTGADGAPKGGLSKMADAARAGKTAPKDRKSTV